MNNLLYVCLWICVIEKAKYMLWNLVYSTIVFNTSFLSQLILLFLQNYLFFTTWVNTFNDYTWGWVKSFSVPHIFLLKLDACEIRYKIVLSLLWFRHLIFFSVNVLFHIVKYTLTCSLSLIFSYSHFIIRASWFSFASVTCTWSLQIIIERWLVNSCWLLNRRIVVPLLFRRSHFDSSIFVKVSTSSSSPSIKRLVPIIMWGIIITDFGIDALWFLFESWTLLFLGFIQHLLANWHHSIWNSISRYVGLKFRQVVRHLWELFKRTHLC